MKRNAGYLYLLITFFCWGSIYVVSKYALAVMGPVTVSFCRYLVSVVCLYGILKWKGGHKKIAKEHWPYLLILGGLGYFAAIILQLGGTALLSGSLASLINSLNPVMISILAAVFLKEKITWKNVLTLYWAMEACRSIRWESCFLPVLWYCGLRHRFLSARSPAIMIRCRSLCTACALHCCSIFRRLFWKIYL